MSPTENPPAAPPRRILVADDERHIVRLIERALVNAGYEVITAYDAAEAYEKARTERPDVIFLDSIMPGTDRVDGFPPGEQAGIGLIKLLRADPAFSKTPIILIPEPQHRPWWRFWAR